MNEPCGIRGPCPDLAVLIHESGSYEHGTRWSPAKLYLGVYQITNCPFDHAALPGLVIEAWDWPRLLPSPREHVPPANDPRGVWTDSE